MRGKIKVLGLLLGAVLLVTVSVFGTLAYLTDQASVQNTFTVGNVKLTLDEAKVDDDGSALTSAARVDTNSYHLIPNHKYAKDPTVHVLAGSESCYVRLKLTINCCDKLDTIFSGHNETLLTGFTTGDWVRQSDPVSVDNTRTYEFRYKDVVAKSDAQTELAPLFTKVEVPAWLTNEQLADLETLEIKVIAEAIQSYNFADADAAWAAFDALSTP